MLEECREKDPSIQEVVRRLRERLGQAIAIADHWEADLCAVGIVAPNSPGRLAYLTSLGTAKGCYTVHLELPPQAGSNLPYETADVHKELDIDEVVSVVAAHLGVGFADHERTG